MPKMSKGVRWVPVDLGWWSLWVDLGGFHGVLLVFMVVFRRFARSFSRFVVAKAC